MKRFPPTTGAPLPRPSAWCLALGTCVVAGACSSSRQLGHGVHVSRFEPEARLEGELRDESYSGGAGAKTKEHILRENVQFDFDGDVYDPKLVSVRGLVDLGLEQREIDQSGAPTTTRSHDDNNRYDLHAAIVKDHPYSLHLFALRNQARVRQSFFPTSDAVVTKHGATVMAKEWIVPSQVEVSSYHFEGKGSDLRREQRDTINATGARNTDALSVNYQVFAQNVDSDLAGGKYDDFQALAGASWRFGSDYGNSIGVDGQQRRQTGDTENENSSLGARSRFELTDELDNRTGVSFGRSTFGVDADRTDRTDVYSEFEHRLYESLTTVLRGDYLEQHIGDGDLTRTGGSGRLHYRKKVSFGEVHATYQQSHSRQEEHGRFGANVTVNDEPHVIAPGDPVILANQNVDVARILVTDATGAIVFATPGDYLIETVGTTTRLTIPATSLILVGQTILVTYAYAVARDQTFDSDLQFASLQFVFGEGLSLEGHWSLLDQQLVAGVTDAALDHATEVGADARAKLGEHNVVLEYLDHDSLLAPYTRSRFTWYTWVPVSPEFSLSANASVYETRFKDEGLSERGLSALASFGWHRAESLSWELRGELRRSELRSEDGWGEFVQSILRYDWRKSSVDLTVLASREQWEVSSDRDILRAIVTFRRRF